VARGVAWLAFVAAGGLRALAAQGTSTAGAHTHRVHADTLLRAVGSVIRIDSAGKRFIRLIDQRWQRGALLSNLTGARDTAVAIQQTVITTFAEDAGEYDSRWIELKVWIGPVGQNIPPRWTRRFEADEGRIEGPFYAVRTSGAGDGSDGARYLRLRDGHVRFAFSATEVAAFELPTLELANNWIFRYAAFQDRYAPLAFPDVRALVGVLQYGALTGRMTRVRLLGKPGDAYRQLKSIGFVSDSGNKQDRGASLTLFDASPDHPLTRITRVGIALRFWGASQEPDFDVYIPLHADTLDLKKAKLPAGYSLELESASDPR
jgi:hypothetical protein